MSPVLNGSAVIPPAVRGPKVLMCSVASGTNGPSDGTIAMAKKAGHEITAMAAGISDINIVLDGGHSAI